MAAAAAAGDDHRAAAEAATWNYSVEDGVRTPSGEAARLGMAGVGQRGLRWGGFAAQRESRRPRWRALGRRTCWVVVGAAVGVASREQRIGGEGVMMYAWTGPCWEYRLLEDTAAAEVSEHGQDHGERLLTRRRKREPECPEAESCCWERWVEENWFDSDGGLRKVVLVTFDAHYAEKMEVKKRKKEKKKGRYKRNKNKQHERNQPRNVAHSPTYLTKEPAGYGKPHEVVAGRGDIPRPHSPAAARDAREEPDAWHIADSCADGGETWMTPGGPRSPDAP